MSKRFLKSRAYVKDCDLFFVVDGRRYPYNRKVSTRTLLNFCCNISFSSGNPYRYSKAKRNVKVRGE